MPLFKQILVQENDYVRAGLALSDGAIIQLLYWLLKCPTAVQEYCKRSPRRLSPIGCEDSMINTLSVIVRQMMRKVEVIEPRYSFLRETTHRQARNNGENDRIWAKKVVTDSAT